MLKEFKDFVSRGNVLDLAVAVIIGAAFGSIVTSLVKDIIMPPIGLILGHVDFSNLFINLSGTSYASLAEAQKAGAATINYGLFINSVLNFLIVAFAIFVILRIVNRNRAKAPATTKACPYCASTIAIAAVRCPQCTSDLQSSNEPERVAK
jgi:large conductance mechanosensitive channel